MALLRNIRMAKYVTLSISFSNDFVYILLVLKEKNKKCRASTPRDLVTPLAGS